MSLAQLLARRIEQNGPISVADYMTECLLHPAFGYYATRDPFGTSGDFTTAPEISQMFGELLGLCLAQVWVDQGQPARFVLADLGPGRGTMMADMLRATAQVPGFHAAADIVLVEASEHLRSVQAKTLGTSPTRWLDSVDQLPDLPLFITANEFFDALPIRQFVRTKTGWRERQVGLGDGKLAFGLSAELPQPTLVERLADTSEGDLVEVASSAGLISENIGRRIEKFGGAALIVDYGDWRSLGDTLQALRAHAPVDPLDTPGTADLTAHVDFEVIALAAACGYTRLTPQGIFLERLGITQRAQKLAAASRAEALEELISAHRRLTHPAQMGNLFKVLGLFPTGQAPPPGLEV